MKTKTKLLTILLLGLYLTSCGNKSKEQTYTVPDMHTSEISVDWQGTYTGVTRAADCPGIYVMLALDSDKYEVMNKYLDRSGIFIDKGDFTINNDSVIIENVPYKIGENMLFNSIDTLYKQNNETSLPSTITQQIMIQNNGNERAVLQQYFENGKKIAEFTFNNKNYILNVAQGESNTIEYTDGKNSLQIGINDTNAKTSQKVIFNDVNNKYEFTIVSPTNEVYTSKNALFYDVLYFNDNTGNFIMLLTTDRKECYILPQTEAWAKGAIYEQDGIEWKSNNTTATLTKNGKSFNYRLNTTLQ